MVVALLMAIPAAPGAVEAQPPAQASPDEAEERTAQTYTLEIANEGITEISLEADEVKLSQIAADLSRGLRSAVIVGPAIQDETITLRFVEVTLEPALRLLAPRVYVDYEIRHGAPPAPKGIYLLGYGDPEPALNAVIRGASQGILITGHTEDTGEASARDVLQVERTTQDRLTIISRQQPLAAVVMAVAEALGVPAELTYDALEMVDTTIIHRRLEDASPAISPNIRLYLRADVNRSASTPLRLVVVPPVLEGSPE
jgi:hypothetical protein